MKNIAVKNSIVPSKPRSGNYPLGSTVVKAGFGEATVINQEGESVDILKKDDSRLITDSRVMSALRAMDEFISKKNDSNISVIVDWLKGIKLNGKELKSVIQENDSEESSDSNILSSLRTLKEIAERSLSKKNADQAAEIIDFLKGWTVGDKASIDKDGIATVQQLIALVKAKVTDLEVTNAATAKTVTVSDKVTTLNLLVQKLAEMYDLKVSNVATLFRTIITDYVSSETFISGLAGEGFKLYKALSGDWNLELDNLTIRKAMTVFELIISKIRAVNGGLVVSQANGRVKSVNEDTTNYVLGIEGNMTFEADDFVRCQVFGSSGAKYYWVRVSSVSNDSIIIAKSEFSEGTVPAVGDDLVQMGNKSNTARQGILYLTASEDGKPRFSVLDGVNSTDLTGKNKLILGCLDGITDSDFPSDAQPSGYGLWAVNVFLKGLFILRNGKSIEDELNDQITAVRTAFEIREGQISSKVTEAAVAATNAGNSAVLAQGYASTAGQKASAAAGSASDAANILTTVTQKETSINQTADVIELKAVRAESAAGRAESAEASINLKADEIVLQASNQAAKSAVDELSNKTGTQLLPNDWTVGDDGTPFFSVNGLSSENQRIIGANHLGQNVVLWLCKPSGDGYGDGGWDTSYVSVDKTKTYRFSVFVKKVNASGIFYLGAGSDSVCDLNTTTKNSNPYFYSSRLSGQRLNSWLLITGYVYPYGITGLSNADGEIWDCETGQLLGSTGSFNWAADAVSTCHRCYLFYNDESTNRQYMYAPRIDLIDGNEPSIAQLLGMSAIQSYATTKANTAEDNAKQYANNTFTTKTTYEAGIQILSGQISSKVSQTDFNSLGATVSSHTSAVNQLPTTINQRITSQVADGGIIKTNVESWFTLSGNTISLGAKSLDISGAVVFNSLATQSQAQGYAKTAVDGVQVGGRNLALNSDIYINNNEYNIRDYLLSQDLIAGEIYTATIWGSLYSSKSHFGMWMGGGYTGISGLSKIKDGVYQATFTMPNSVEGNGYKNVINIYTVPYNIVGISTIYKFKLEQGNKATDWTPAPEDVAQDASNKANTAESNAKGYSDVLRNNLGSLAYENTVSLAKLDTTIIEGGYIKTSLINANAIITNDLLATKIAATDITTRRLTVGEGCMVGGFSIGSGRIGISASPENIGNAGMFLYADMIGFNSTNRQAIVGTYSVLGYPRLGQFIDTTSNYMPNVGLMFDINSTNNGGRNYAFVGRGNGVLNGFMCGYAFQELSFTSANQWQEISKLTSVVGIYGNYNNWAVVLPTFASVCNALNIGYNTPFVFQITVLCTSAVDSGKLYGRSNSGISGISGYGYPELHDWNNGIDNGGYVMGAGDSFQIVLFGQNNGTSSIPVASGSYRAYIVNKLS